MTDDRTPEDFDTYNDFARAIHDALPDEWDTMIDEQALKQGHDRIGFQRDDLYRFMISIYDDWPVDSITLYLPEGIDQIADRPGIPSYHVENPSIDNILTTINNEAPNYQGTFTYDDE